MNAKGSRSSSSEVLRRSLALWFPYLATDRLHIRKGLCAKPGKRPLVIAEKVRGALRLSAVDPQAGQCGLSVGLTLADARARIRDLEVAVADPVGDAEYLKKLALFCERYSPSIAVDAPDGLLLDITGCAHLFGGEERMRALVLSRLRGMGLDVRATIASRPDPARALVRFSQSAICPAGSDEKAVYGLPIAALSGVPGDTMLALSRAGLKTIGALAARPSRILAARFGQDLVTRLAITLGREASPLKPLRALPDIAVSRHFPEPLVQAEALEEILGQLIEEAATAMQARDLGGRRFEASLFRSDGMVTRLHVETGRPSREASSIRRLFRERLATLADPIDRGFGFDAIRLAVPIAAPLGAHQHGLDTKEARLEDSELDDLVDRLVVRFGREAVLKFEACDTHIPERAARRIAALMPPASRRGRGMTSAASCPAAWPQPEIDEPPRRPLQLFHPPQQVEAIAEVPDGPPRRFRWRRVLHEIVLAEGPERIAPEWWRTRDEPPPARDYYRVEDRDGHRFWMFRSGTYGQPGEPPRWFVHGVFV